MYTYVWACVPAAASLVFAPIAGYCARCSGSEKTDGTLAQQTAHTIDFRSVDAWGRGGRGDGELEPTQLALIGLESNPLTIRQNVAG